MFMQLIVFTIQKSQATKNGHGTNLQTGKILGESINKLILFLIRNLDNA